MKFTILTLVALTLFITGCGDDSDTSTPSTPSVPSFLLAWSEWPGWSTFYVAHQLGVINGDRGAQGSLEKKYGVDIVLKELEYPPCITGFPTTLEVACLTNMDSLPAAVSNEVVAILINDTSCGGDMWLTTDPNLTWDSIKNAAKPVEVFGEDKSVSQYACIQLCKLHGVPDGKVKFVHLDAGQASIAMQQGQKTNIFVWNPFCLQVLNTQKKARVFTSSKEIPGQIWDLVVTTQKTLEKPGGENFAKCVCAAYYAVMARLSDPSTKDDTLTRIGEKFSRLPIEEMRKVEQGTSYITTPTAGADFFRSPERVKTMELALDFGDQILELSRRPKVAFGSRSETGKVDFRFDPMFMLAVK